MFLDKDSIKISIDGTNFISLGQYLTNAKFGWHKVWKNDTGRALNGDFKGTLDGIYPKITLYFGRLDETKMKIIAPILDAGKQYVKYVNNDGVKKQMETYSGDWEVTYKTTRVGEAFNCSIISIKKRS